VIFVCTGASRPFDRLIKEVDRIAEKGEHKFLVQLGRTAFEPRYCEFFRFKPHDEIVDTIKSSDLVITHGGFGTLFDCLTVGKPVIAVPKTFELDETDNDQTEIIRFLESKGKLLGVYDVHELERAIGNVDVDYIPVRFNRNITKAIEDFIEAEWAKNE
jgi:UDP-N-acetylglucosamine transferase subunit ALG13